MSTKICSEAVILAGVYHYVDDKIADIISDEGECQRMISWLNYVPIKTKEPKFSQGFSGKFTATN